MITLIEARRRILKHGWPVLVAVNKKEICKRQAFAVCLSAFTLCWPVPLPYGASDCCPCSPSSGTAKPCFFSLPMWVEDQGLSRNPLVLQCKMGAAETSGLLAEKPGFCKGKSDIIELLKLLYKPTNKPSFNAHLFCWFSSTKEHQITRVIVQN